MAGKADSLKTIFYALGANFAIFVAKLAAAIVTGSGAMTAEAVHSLADCGNQVLLLLGMNSAKAPPSPDHPLGQGKAVYFWSFLVALMLFSVGGMFSIYEGVHKLAASRAAAAGRGSRSACSRSASSPKASRCGAACAKSTRRAASANLWRWFRESRQSELIVIFGEDLAALLGLVVRAGRGRR